MLTNSQFSVRVPVKFFVNFSSEFLFLSTGYTVKLGSTSQLYFEGSAFFRKEVQVFGNLLSYSRSSGLTVFIVIIYVHFNVHQNNI
jgi:hypothetical protein